MDQEQLVRRASGGDVSVRRPDTALPAFRLWLGTGSGSRSFRKPSWPPGKALPTLAEPAAFPGWLRSIVRHHAFRVLRRKQLHAVSLTEAEDVASDDPPADHIAEQRRQAAAALAAISELPDTLREPAALFLSMNVGGYRQQSPRPAHT
jgi:hypothetical protein